MKSKIHIITQRITSGEITHLVHLKSLLRGHELSTFLARMHYEHDKRSEKFDLHFVNEFDHSPQLLELIDNPTIAIMAGTFIKDAELLESHNSNTDGPHAAYAVTLSPIGASGWRGDVLLLDAHFKAIGTAVYAN